MKDKPTTERIEKIKQNTKNLIFSMTKKEMEYVMGTVRGQMIIESGKNSTTHFVCPITSKVLARKSGKKIITSDKETKSHREQSWYYMSVKAFNSIKAYK